MKLTHRELEQKLTGFNRKHAPIEAKPTNNRKERRALAAMQRRNKTSYHSLSS